MLIIAKNLYLTKVSVHMVRYGCIKGYNENLEYYKKKIVLKKSVMLIKIKDTLHQSGLRYSINTTRSS